MQINGERDGNAGVEYLYYPGYVRLLRHGS
jgi:hypothetical protein